MEYFVEISYKKRNTAGAKAPQDVIEICRARGMKPFFMPAFPAQRGKLYRKLWLVTVLPLYWFRLWRRLTPDDSILFQFPMSGNRLAVTAISLIKKSKKCRFFVLIHDLESLRKGIQGIVANDPKRNEVAEGRLLKQFDKIICHNRDMKEYLAGTGIPFGKIECLEIFDYLCDDFVQRERTDSTEIVIAGNLAGSKCGYIYKLNGIGHTFHLYGPNFNPEAASENLRYQGSFPPEELPGKLSGKFGLVWDGPDIHSCSGNTGEYLRYNAPHKTSLYLAAGLPVIIWKEAAMARFVRQNQVGIVIEDLAMLDRTVSSVSPQEYQMYCDNAKKIGEQLRKGHFLNFALDRCVRPSDVHSGRG